MSQNQGEILQTAIREISLLNEAALSEKMNDFLEVQPYLTGFLYNLADDFTEEEHTYILRVAVILHEAFKMAGMQPSVVGGEAIEAIIAEKVEAYEKYASNDLLGEDEMLKVSSSPRVFQDLKNYLVKELEDEFPKGLGDQQNLMLIVEVILGCMELGAAVKKDASDNPKKDEQ